MSDKDKKDQAKKTASDMMKKGKSTRDSVTSGLKGGKLTPKK